MYVRFHIKINKNETINKIINSTSPVALPVHVFLFIFYYYLYFVYIFNSVLKMFP